jgi:hypothetical protein
MTFLLSYRLDYEDITIYVIFVFQFNQLFHLTTTLPPMQNTPIILTSESVEALVANIAEELLKGHNTYKSETAALKKKIKIGMLRTISYQELMQTKKQHSHAV